MFFSVLAGLFGEFAQEFNLFDAFLAEREVVGGVGVSGLPEEEDMVLAALGARIIEES